MARAPKTQDDESHPATKTTPCGLIMPIAFWDDCGADHWIEVREIIEAALAPDYSARLVSAANSSSIIAARIVTNVYDDPIVVCDVSGRNPNVMFELGLRLAFNRPVVIIKDDKTPFSFDTQMIEHIEYPRSLRHSGIEAFKSLLLEKVNHAVSYKGPTFIETLRHVTITELQEVHETPNEAILTAIREVQEQVSVLMGQSRMLSSATPSVTSNSGILDSGNFELVKLRRTLQLASEGGISDGRLLEFGVRQCGGLLPLDVIRREVDRAITRRRRETEPLPKAYTS